MVVTELGRGEGRQARGPSGHRSGPRPGWLLTAILGALAAACATQSTGDAPSAITNASPSARGLGTGDAPAASAPEHAVALFASHYEARLGPVAVRRRAIPGGEEITLSSPLLKGPGNEPQLLAHPGGPTEDVIVLCHGLSDSPHYMRAVGDGFFAAGANVVLPLLPAHGLVDPDAAMEDPDLDRKWVAAFDHAVDTAGLLGRRISLGGFSTGGTLSVHKALRDPERVRGGLFLFAPALSVGTINENLAWSVFIVPRIAKWQDGHYAGRGPNPYKYPAFPQFGGLELIDVIHDVNRLIDERGGPVQPVFIAHSIHDASALPEGTGKLLRARGVRGVAIVFAANPPVEHARLTLAEDIPLDPAYLNEGERPANPRAFPAFDRMMDLVLTFFERLPVNATKPAGAGAGEDEPARP